MKLSDLLANYKPQSSPFATHVNLLRAVGAEVKTVLELGAGSFSTPLFLDRTWYPNLDRLVTIESDMHWAAACSTDDPRHRMIATPEPIENYLALTTSIADFDLVFIDNSASGDRRSETINYISKNLNHGSLAIAHDWQVPSYREAGSAFTHQFIDDRQEPWTALLWK